MVFQPTKDAKERPETLFATWQVGKAAVAITSPGQYGLLYDIRNKRLFGKFGSY